MQNFMLLVERFRTEIWMGWTAVCPSSIIIRHTPQLSSNSAIGEWMTSELPSGELTVCNWKWPLIVDFPMKNGDVPWQNVSSPEGIWAIWAIDKRQISPFLVVECSSLCRRRLADTFWSYKVTSWSLTFLGGFRPFFGLISSLISTHKKNENLMDEYWWHLWHVWDHMSLWC